jgi:hypothetical protein
MENVYALLVLACLVLLVVGLINPSKGLFWLKQGATRKKSTGIYAGATFLFLFLLGTTVDKKHPRGASVAASASTDSTAAPAVAQMTEAEKAKMIAEYEAKYKAQAEEEAKERAAKTIDSRQLVAQYAANEVKADQLFKGNKFYVTGTITDIKKDLSDEIYVTLQGDGELREVRCFFDNEDIAADFRKGQQVTFEGTCAGLMMDVLMKDCTLVVD